MAALDEVRGIYDTYLDAITEYRRNMKFGEGMMGFRGGVADAPCNQTFIRDLGSALTRAAETAGSEEARGLMEYVYRQSGERACEKAAYWMLLAAHTLTDPLVSNLTPADASWLAARYEILCPKGDRLPAQKKLLARLKAQAGER